MLGLADSFMAARRQRMAEDEAAATRAERAERLRWAREDRDRLARDRASEDAAFGELAAAQSGIGAGDVGRIQQTYGMTPQQVAATGGGQGLVSKLKEYDQPDSWDLQGAPSVGAGRGLPAPGMTAADVKPGAAKKSDIHGALMKVATARRDAQGFASAMAARDTAVEDETMGAVKLAKPGTPEWTAQMESVRSQLRGHKQITLGKPDKQGFVNLSYEDAGGGTVFAKLSAADQHALLMADSIMERNPTRALQMIRGVNAELAAAIARDNDGAAKVGTHVNDVAHKRGALANQAAQIANTAEYHRGMLAARKDEVTRNSWQPEQYVDDKGVVRVYDVNRTGKTPEFRERALPAGLRPYKAAPELRVNADGSVQRGDKLYVPDPKSPNGFREVSFGPSALDRALAGDTGDGAAPGPKPLKPFTKDDLNPPSTSNMDRVSERSWLGGIGYVYKDRTTGKKYSVQEYNRLLDQGY